MTYRELLEITKNHPNPFWKKNRHEREFEQKYRAWLELQNQSQDSDGSHNSEDKEDWT